MHYTVVGVIDCVYAYHVGSRALSFSGPLLSVSVEFYMSATLRSNISKTKGARRKVTIGSL